MGRWSRCKQKQLYSNCQQLAVAVVHCFLCYSAVTDLVHTESIDAFNDNIAFQMKWAGTIWNNAEGHENSLVMTTENREKYVCTIPDIEITNAKNANDYKGPTALKLLKPLFSKVTCTYRLEQFWTYELCHGHHLRQYHEESTLQGMHVLEFILGRFDAEKYAEEQSMVERKAPPTKRMGDKDRPYVELVMGDGSVCDVNGEPRVTRVLYFCKESGHNELHSVDEISSCEYEVVVLTPLLCQHPLYTDKDKPVNRIQCHAVNESPIVPANLLQLEREEKEYEIAQEEEYDIHEELKIPPPPPAPNEQKSSFPHDPKLVADFLSGRHCLQGGSGWWKYEFCFGKKVEQYHEEYRQSRTVVLLGKWNEDAHIAWIKNNPQKKPTSKQVLHFYGDGSICDETGQPRQVEVKLRCRASSSQSNTVAMFLLEPRTCKYTLTVETPIVCPLLETANEYGLFRQKQLL